MKNSADQGGLRGLQNYSYPTKAEFNNCFIIHSKYFPFFELYLLKYLLVGAWSMLWTGQRISESVSQ